MPLNNRAGAWWDKGDFDRAIADYSAAVRLDPNNAVALTNRGVVWRDKGNIDRAIADYNEAIRVDPKYATAFIYRGWDAADRSGCR